MYFITQYLVGFGTYVIYVVGFVLVIELTSSKKANFVSIYILQLFVFGQLLIMTASYFLRNWHYQNYFVTGYSITIFFLIVFVLPESPKLLVTKKRYSEAHAIVSKIAKFNGKTFTMTVDEMIKEISDESKLLPTTKIDNDTQESETKQSVMSYLFNYKENLIKTILLAYVWIALSMVYYGIGLGN